MDGNNIYYSYRGKRELFASHNDLNYDVTSVIHMHIILLFY
ncbi:hypothetical protein [Wolbachia endosymbiont (group B) of Sphaerophoria taeniata]|nr:hypothetical protein [Wolbachia endosymbiont (group B) of Sphaerophoria taeniata]